MSPLENVSLRVADAIDRWLMRVHSPLWVESRETPALCTAHWRRTTWPCADYIAAVERIDERRELRKADA